MKRTVIGLMGLLTAALAPGPAGAFSHSGSWGGSTSHSRGSTSHSNAYGGSSSHSYGEGSSHTNAYGGTTSGAYGQGATHTNPYGGTTSGAYGQGATHTNPYGTTTAYHPPTTVNNNYYGVCVGRDRCESACRLRNTQRRLHDLLPVRQHLVPAVLWCERRLLPCGAHSLRRVRAERQAQELRLGRRWAESGEDAFAGRSVGSRTSYFCWPPPGATNERHEADWNPKRCSRPDRCLLARGPSISPPRRRRPRVRSASRARPCASPYDASMSMAAGEPS